MSDKKELTDLEKLRVLIPHWLEHSHSHRHEFEKWLAVAKNGGQEEAAEAIDRAMHKLAKADNYLRRALEALGGALEGQHSHQHEH